MTEPDGGTCYTTGDIAAAGEAAAAGLPPLTQDQADMAKAILTPHQGASDAVA